MTTRLEALLEAERRGLLPQKEMQALQEARRRGLLPQEAATSPEPTATPSQEDVSTLMQTPVGRGRAALQSGLQGATFGLGEELTAGLGALGAYPIMKIRGLGDQSLADLYREGLEGERAGIKSAREQYPAQSLAGEIAGGLATGGALAGATKALAPRSAAALASFAKARPYTAAASTAGGTGALYGFGTAEGTPTERALPALTTGAISAPFGPLSAAVGKTVSPKLAALGEKISRKIIKRTGAMGDDIMSESALAKLSPQQQQRVLDLEAAGIPRQQQTAAMITRDPKQWQFEQNIRGVADVGDEIRSRYSQANELIKNKLGELGVKTGGKASTAFEAGESVTEAVLKKSKEMQSEIGGLYSKIRDEVGENVGFIPKKILLTLDEASDNAYADNIVNSMTRKMKRYGIIDSSGNLVDDVSLSVKNAEELRKFANSLRGDKQTDHIVSNIIDSLDDDVIDTAGTDAFKVARDKARERFSEFETKILKNISEEKLVSDDVLARTVYGGKVKDLRSLKDSLLSGTGEQVQRGTNAWNDLKLQTLQRIIDDSSTPAGKLQGSRLNRQLEKIGKERLETVFDPSELLQLKTIQKALEYTTVEVPESVVNYSGTGAATANNALAGILKKSTSGELLQKGAQTLSRIPVLGQITAPGTALIGASGKQLQSAAMQSSLQASLDPLSALKAISRTTPSGKGGIIGGVIGQQFTRENENY